MANVTLTRNEATLFLCTLLVPLAAIAVVAVVAYPPLQWMLPTSMFFPAGLLAGIAMRGRSVATAPRAGEGARPAGA